MKKIILFLFLSMLYLEGKTQTLITGQVKQLMSTFSGEPMYYRMDKVIFPDITFFYHYHWVVRNGQMDYSSTNVATSRPYSVNEQQYDQERANPGNCDYRYTVNNKAVEDVMRSFLNKYFTPARRQQLINEHIGLTASFTCDGTGKILRLSYKFFASVPNVTPEELKAIDQYLWDTRVPLDDPDCRSFKYLSGSIVLPYK